MGEAEHGEPWVPRAAAPRHTERRSEPTEPDTAPNLSFLVLSTAMGCPGRWRSARPWGCLRKAWTRSGGVRSLVGLGDLRGLFQPNWSCDSVIKCVSSKASRCSACATSGCWGCLRSVSSPALVRSTSTSREQVMWNNKNNLHHNNLHLDVSRNYGLRCVFSLIILFLFCFLPTSDTLWDLAIAEVEKRKNPDDEDVKPGEVWEKSILFMGNKNGVILNTVQFYTFQT